MILFIDIILVFVDLELALLISNQDNLTDSSIELISNNYSESVIYLSNVNLTDQ